MATLAETPIIPDNAAGYSTIANAKNARDKAQMPDGTVDVLLLVHHFLRGMPPATEATRALSSTAGPKAKESPLFDKVFHVPLPWKAEQVEFSGPQEPVAVFKAMDDAGNMPGPYKTDIVVYDHADRGTLKITQWHEDDPRGEHPHNHPWADEESTSFVSYIVRGGYTETITDIEGNKTTRDYRAGDLNIAKYTEFHSVDGILPGTLTVLMCAPRAIVKEKGTEWGFLLFNDGKPERVGMTDPRVKDDSFLQRAAVQNPSLRLIYQK